MSYVEVENGNHVLDEDGNKISYTVTYETDNIPAYTYREPIHINDDGHIDNENRNIVIKDGDQRWRSKMAIKDADHAISKGQLDNTKSEITTQIHSSIQTALNKFSVELQKAMIQFRNEQIRGRIGRKSLTIPKTNYSWIPLLSASDIDGITSLQDVIIQNVYIRRNDRYHHSKSDLVASSFDQLEFFFKSDFSIYYCYFNNHPSDWSMECFLEYIVIPKEINVEDSDNDDNE